MGNVAVKADSFTAQVLLRGGGFSLGLLVAIY